MFLRAFVIFPLLCVACTNDFVRKYDGQPIWVSDIYENSQTYKNQEVVLEGYIKIDADFISLHQSLKGESDYILIESGKIDRSDRGFHGHKVVLLGTIKKFECSETDVYPFTCGTFITDYTILEIE